MRIYVILVASIFVLSSCIEKRVLCQLVIKGGYRLDYAKRDTVYSNSSAIIKGEVYDVYTEKDADECFVIVRSSDSIYRTSTDSSGHFYLELEEGTYKLKFVRAKNTPLIIDTLKINRADNINIRVLLGTSIYY